MSNIEYPSEFTTLREFREDIFRANCETVGVDVPNEAEYLGEGVSIGVADSVYAPEGGDEQYNVVENHDCLPDTKPHINDTLGHGSEVLDILYSLLPEADFHLYRISEKYEDDGVWKRGFYQSSATEAFGYAIEEEVDILHFSNGIPQPSVGDIQWFEEKVAQLTASDITLVAAAGNSFAFDREKHEDEVFHPARYSTTVSIGGLQSRCRPTDSHKDSCGHWVRLTDYDQLQGPYCSHECDEQADSCRRQETKWGGNVGQVNGKPDLYAPVHHLSITEQDYSAKFDEGTSFAAPYVTGILGRIFQQEASNLTPEEALERLLEIQQELEDGHGVKPDFEQYSPSQSSQLGQQNG